MSEAVETIKKDGLTARIYIDEHPDGRGPREWDNVGTMAFWHKRYSLGDDISMFDWAKDPAACKEFLDAENAVALAVFMYDHSGLALSTEPFHCRWDSGQIGWIFVLPEKIKEEGIDRETALMHLGEEVKIYGRFIGGEVYHYSITRKKTTPACEHCGRGEETTEEDVDSCSGFYGIDDVREAVEESLTSHAEPVVLARRE